MLGTKLESSAKAVLPFPTKLSWGPFVKENDRNLLSRGWFDCTVTLTLKAFIHPFFSILLNSQFFLSTLPGPVLMIIFLILRNRFFKVPEHAFTFVGAGLRNKRAAYMNFFKTMVLLPWK